MTLVLGTSDGVFALEAGGTHEPRRLGLEGARVTHVALHGDRILAAVPRDGLHELSLEREGARRLYEGDVRSCAVSPGGDAFWLGVEPAMIHRSLDDGASWQRLDAIDALPTRADWTFPPPPHEAHVLSIDFVPGEPETVLAGIEVGGVIHSSDRGETFVERNEGIYVDVHSVRPDPARPGRWLAVTGAGFYASEDAGVSWERRMEGMGNGYTIGLHVHPRSGALLVSSGDRPPGLNGRVYHSDDVGKTWFELPEEATHGPHKRAPVPFFSSGGDAVWLGTDGGRLLRAEAPLSEWALVAELPAAVNTITDGGSPSSVMH